MCFLLCVVSDAVLCSNGCSLCDGQLLQRWERRIRTIPALHVEAVWGSWCQPRQGQICIEINVRLKVTPTIKGHPKVKKQSLFTHSYVVSIHYAVIFYSAALDIMNVYCGQGYSSFKNNTKVCISKLMWWHWGWQNGIHYHICSNQLCNQ